MGSSPLNFAVVQLHVVLAKGSNERNAVPVDVPEGEKVGHTCVTHMECVFILNESLKNLHMHGYT